MKFSTKDFERHFIDICYIFKFNILVRLEYYATFFTFMIKIGVLCNNKQMFYFPSYVILRNSNFMKIFAVLKKMKKIQRKIEILRYEFLKAREDIFDLYNIK